MAVGEDLSYVVNDIQARLAVLEQAVTRRYTSLAAAVAATPNPVSGMQVYVDSNDSGEGNYTFNGSNWRPSSWTEPWGLRTLAIGGSDQTGVTTTADIAFTANAVSWTGVSNRLYRLTLSAWIQQVTAAGTMSVFMQSGASGAGTNLMRVDIPAQATHTQGYLFTAYMVGSGALTAHARVATTAGTVSILGATGATGWMTVEDIGPIGAPA